MALLSKTPRKQAPLDIGGFKSLEECRNDSVFFLRKISGQYAGDFECGLNCKGLNCEETSR